MTIFDEFPVLEGKHAILRKMTAQDVDGLEKMKSEADVYRYEPSFLPERLCPDTDKFIRTECDRLFQAKENILLGIYPADHPEQFIGIAELYGYDAERSKVSVGYRLLKEMWRHGYATETASLLKKYILEDLGLIRITAHVISENEASAKALLKNGFVQRRHLHEEDWGMGHPVLANKYVIYPEWDTAVE